MPSTFCRNHQFFSIPIFALFFCIISAKLSGCFGATTGGGGGGGGGAPGPGGGGGTPGPGKGAGGGGGEMGDIGKLEPCIGE